MRARTKEEFLALIKKRLQRGIPAPDPERVTRAVFKLIAQRVSQDEIRDVCRMLPAEIAELWPAPTGAP